MRFVAEIDGESQEVELREDGTARVGERELSYELMHRDGELWQLRIDGRPWLGVVRAGKEGRRFSVGQRGSPLRMTLKTDLEMRLGAGSSAQAAAGREVRSLMPGVVTQVFVAEGDQVAEGAVLLVLEAMKMQNEIQAEVAGSVARVHVTQGQAVAADELLVEINS